MIALKKRVNALLSATLAAAAALACCAQTYPRQVIPLPEPVPVSAPIRQPLTQEFGYNHDMDICSPYNPEKNCGMRTSIFPMMRKAGMTWQRYALYWNMVQTAPDTFDWTMADEAVRLAAEQGIKTYMSISSSPAWATGGQTWNQGLHCMVKPWATPEEKAKYAPYDDFLFDVPECANPAPIDTIAFTTFVEAVMRRYDGKHGLPDVSYFGFTNEASSAFFWPPRYAHRDKPLDQQLDELYDWLLKPGYDVAKRVGTEQGRTINIVGPDENNANYFRAFLALEERRGRVFDVLSVHSYGRTPTIKEDIPLTVDDIARQLDNEFLQYSRSYGEGRKFWITESGFRFDAPVPGIDGLALQADVLRDIIDVVRARPGIGLLFFYRADENKNPWPPYDTLPNTLGLIDGDTPRPAYDAVKDAILRR